MPNNNRITNGECANHHYGDKGYSLLLNGDKLRKDEPAAAIYSFVEHLQNSLSELLTVYTIHDSELFTVCEWLRSNSYSISSFVFMKGDTNDHVFPENFLEYLDKRIDELQNEIGSAPDFIIHSYKQLLLLDKIRIQIRDIERGYTSFQYHDKVIQDLMRTLRINPFKAQERLLKIDLMSSILNRLSSYFWWETRYEHQLLKRAGILDEHEAYWHSKVVPFVLVDSCI